MIGAFSDPAQEQRGVVGQIVMLIAGNAEIHPFDQDSSHIKLFLQSDNLAAQIRDLEPASPDKQKMVGLLSHSLGRAVGPVACSTRCLRNSPTMTNQ